MEIRNYGKVNEIVPVPDLVQLQTAAYLRFLQRDIDHEKREDRGLESILREVFPIENNDKSLKLEFLRYELGAPRYTPEECRRLPARLGGALDGTHRRGEQKKPAVLRWALELVAGPQHLLDSSFDARHRTVASHHHR